MIRDLVALARESPPVERYVSGNAFADPAVITFVREPSLVKVFATPHARALVSRSRGVEPCETRTIVFVGGCVPLQSTCPPRADAAVRFAQDQTPLAGSKA